MFFWSRRLGSVKSRTGWYPKLLGLSCVIVLLVIPAVAWLIYGEAFLSLTRRLPAEVLVVEGWIGRDGIRAAGAEFEQRGYQYVVATGGLTEKRSGQSCSTYAEMAESELIRSGIPKDKIIVAPPNTKGQRTYESAVAVWRALQARGIHPKALNVFTLGAHARRSCLVFAKVNRPATQVGVVDWAPPDYEAGPWWRSGERSKCVPKETVAYVFEALLNSGRGSNSPNDRPSSGFVQRP